MIVSECFVLLLSKELYFDALKHEKDYCPPPIRKVIFCMSIFETTGLLPWS